MVARFFLIFLMSPYILFSATFTANVSRNQINLGDSLTLTLTLQDASAKSSPYIEPLIQSFVIHSQQQISNTSILNGKVSTNISWRYVLTAKRVGDDVIPSITIESSEGVLATEPIGVRVVKAAAKSQKKDKEDTSDISIKTTVSNQRPYKNEPVVYTARLTSKQGLVNLQMQKFDVEDAIVEVDEKPKVYEEIVDGMRIGVIEFNYLITPLKSGVLKIPSTMIQGAMPTRKKGLSRSLFDDTFDVFTAMNGFEQYYPFSLATDEIVLNAQPPVPDVNPWLPAKALSIEELWDENQQIQVGEFFSRGFNIVAEGVNANQLPSLSEMQVGGSKVKVYGDKPELFEKTKQGSVRSSRKEIYTLIPQEPGIIVLPEITISWWNTEKREKMVAKVPSRTLHVVPAVDRVENATVQPVIVSTPQQVVVKDTFAEEIQKNSVLYLIIAALGGLFIGVIVCLMVWIWLQKRMMKMIAPPKPALPPKNEVKIEVEKYAPPKSKKDKLNDLNPT